MAWQCYLPKEWADDLMRRDQAGVPRALEFATQPAIALQQIQHLLAQGAPRHCVLADAGYGVDTASRSSGPRRSPHPAKSHPHQQWLRFPTERKHYTSARYLWLR